MGRNLFYEKRSSPYPSSKSLDDGGGGDKIKSILIIFFGAEKSYFLAE